MADDSRSLGRVLHEARQAGGEQRPRPMPVEDWDERDPRLQALDEAMAAAVAARVREQIAGQLEDCERRAREAANAFPRNEALNQRANTWHKAVLVARGQISGEGLLP